jgi:hypothetical protein
MAQDRSISDRIRSQGLSAWQGGRVAGLTTMHRLTSTAEAASPIARRQGVSLVATRSGGAGERGVRASGSGAASGA